MPSQTTEPSLSVDAYPAGKRRSQSAFALLFAFSLIAAVSPKFASAQQTTPTLIDQSASIEGQVTDDKGKPLAGVLISVNNRTLGRTGTLTTVESGRFRFAPLDTGPGWEVGFVKRGYLVEVRYVTLHAGDAISMDVALRSSGVQKLATVSITADPPKKGSPLARKFLSSSELADAKAPNLLATLERLRPMMLAPHHDLGFCLDSFSLYVDGLRRPLFDPEPDAQDSAQAQIRRVPLSQIAFERELEWLRPSEIAEIRYISCDEFVPGIPYRNVIWVVTKRAVGMR